MTEPERNRRRRDASRTRAALLESAIELFGQNGYSATTLRSIGDKAGVDASLIARYFGNKEALYLESITDLPIPDFVDGPLGREAIAQTIRRARSGGVTPVARISLVGTADDEIRTRVGDVVRARVTGTAARNMEEAGVDGARLRADVATAVMLGISVAYSAGVLDELADADPEEVVDLCAAAVRAVLAPGSDCSS